MIYFSFVQGDVTSVAHLAAQGEVQHWGLQPCRLQGDQEDRKLLLVKDKKSSRPPLHYTGVDPNSPQGEQIHFLYRFLEVCPGNRHIFFKFELLMGSKFFTVSTCGAQ